MSKIITPEIIADPEWAKLEELGFVSDYVMLRQPGNHMSPILTTDQALAQGFFPKGTKVRWIDHNGYPYQRDIAREKIGTDRILTVKQCNIGRSSSTYTFEEVEGQWNSVMFEKIDG